MTRLAFMSQEHVDEMNARLADAPHVQEAAASLGAECLLVFELDDGPDGEKVYWQAAIGPKGFRFRLGPPPAKPDVLIRTDYAEMIRSVRAEREGGTMEIDQEVVGDEQLLARMLEILEVARPVATLDTDLPSV
jgi:hypothetical protein